MRTPAPHVHHEHAPLSLADLDAARRERRQDQPPPATRDVLAAANSLTAAGVSPFSMAQLYEWLVDHRAGWAWTTVSTLLLDQVDRADGHLTRVRRDRYVLRDSRAAAPVRGMRVDGHVQAALRALAGDGRSLVTRQEVEEQLRALGVPYASRTVSDGLLRLQRRVPPAVARTVHDRYRLLDHEHP